MRYIGLDFSGGAKAGRKIWIAEYRGKDGDAPAVLACERLTDRLGVRADREAAYAALREFLVAQKGGGDGAMVGCDFPFGVHTDLMREGETWLAWLSDFGKRYRDADAFRDACFEAAGGRELRRRTDTVMRTPFAPTNLWIYKQTFYGVRDLLAPLVLEGAVRVAPMQRRARGKPTLIEVCPASYLEQRGSYEEKYKGRDRNAACVRGQLFEAAVEGLGVRDRELRRRACADPEGDAIDAILCVCAAQCFRPIPRSQRVIAKREGWVYA